MRIPALMLVLLAAACGGDTHEKVAEDKINLIEQIADILEDVTDDASADAAAKRIEALAGEMKAVNERAKALGDPTPELNKQLEEKYKPRTQKILGRIMAVAEKVQEYPVLQEAMQKAKP